MTMQDTPDTPDTTDQPPKPRTPSTSRTAFSGARRGTYFMLDPAPPDEGGDVCFIGVDTDHKYGQHVLMSVSVRNTEPDPTLAADIEAQGQLQPIVVRKNGPVGELVFGRRRLMAIRYANAQRAADGRDLLKVQAIKFQGTDQDLLEALIAENAHRQDETPLERARQAQTLFKMCRNKARVARACNVTPQTVDIWLKVGDLSQEVQHEIEVGNISASAAVELVDLSFEDQVKKLEEVRKAILPAPSPVNGTSNGRSKKRNPSRREVEKAVNPDRIQVPSMKAKRKVVAAIKSGDLQDPGGLQILRWSIGELQASSIKGLTRVLD